MVSNLESTANVPANVMTVLVPLFVISFILMAVVAAALTLSIVLGVIVRKRARTETVQGMPAVGSIRPGYKLSLLVIIFSIIALVLLCTCIIFFAMIPAEAYASLFGH